MHANSRHLESESVALMSFWRALGRVGRRLSSSRTGRVVRLPGLLTIMLVLTMLSACAQSQTSGVTPGRPIHIAANITAFPLLSSEFPIDPGSLVVGSDGNFWFTLRDPGRLGRLTPAGVFTAFTLPTTSAPSPPLFSGLASGHDGGLWLADMANGMIWRFDPTTHAARSFAIPGDQGHDPQDFTDAGDYFQGLAVDRNGIIWASDANIRRLARLDPTSGAVTAVVLPAGTTPSDMTVGSDGAIWVALENPQAFVPGGSLWIAHVDSQTNAIHPFPIPHVNVNVLPPGSNPPQWLTAGPDGNVWFTFNNSGDIGQSAGYITPTGTVKQFPTRTGPWAITSGPDGNLWFTNYGGPLSRITPSGVITNFPFMTDGSDIEPTSVTLGPDNNLWVGYDAPQNQTTRLPGYEGYIARISIAPWS